MRKVVGLDTKILFFKDLVSGKNYLTEYTYQSDVEDIPDQVVCIKVD